MQEKQVIEFYQLRSFGEKIGVTIQFLKQNFKGVSISLFYLAAPPLLIGALASSLYLQRVFNGINTLESGVANPILDIFGLEYFALIVFNSLGTYMIMLAVFGAMISYQEAPLEAITPQRVWRHGRQRAWPLLGASVLLTILISIASLFFLLPGIILFVFWSIVPAIVVFEKKSPFDALGRAFKLMKDKWFSTLGLLIVLAFILSGITTVLSIPLSMGMFVNTITLQEEGVAPASPGIFTYLYIGLTTLVSSLGSALIFIAVNFQYFNLVERADSVGLMSQINQLGENNTPEDEDTW